MESLIIGVIVGIVLAIAFTAMVVLGKSQAKKDARAMIAEGRITDIKKYSVTMNCLAKITGDLEAVDLYQQLKQLKLDV